MANKGLLKIGKNQSLLTTIPIPILRDEDVLVRTKAVALNPADWQNLDEDFPENSKPMLQGHDAAGIIEAVGKGVNERLKVGDRVLVGCHGVNVMNPQDGAFAEHIQSRSDVVVKIPSTMSFTDAATLPAGLFTIGLGFYKHLGLPFPPSVSDFEGGEWIFIYGGSSASGTLAIQFAKLSGLKVVTTCSLRNFSLVKSLGADAVFDYRDPLCASKILTLTSNTLTLVFDTIATPSSAQICASSLSATSSPTKPLLYVNLMGVDAPRPDVKSIFFLGYSAFGRPYIFEGQEWPFVEDEFELAKRFTLFVEGLLEEGNIKSHPATVREGGLEGIVQGMEDIRLGKISGEKLVYVVGEER